MEDAKPAGPRTILIVDDDEMQVTTLTHILEREGFRPAKAMSGIEALHYFDSGTCDLILLDVNMPGMDGFEVCKKLRLNDKTKKIPIIFVTARASSGDYREGIKAGGDTYITKPFRNTQLLMVINTMLAMHRR